MDTSATSGAADADMPRKAPANASNMIDLTVSSSHRPRQLVKIVSPVISHNSSDNSSSTPKAAQSSNDILVPTASTSSRTIEVLPDALTAKITSLRPRDFALLQTKQSLLQTTSICGALACAHADAIRATLVFAQECAGTAVCISPRGLLLTCAHCIAHDAAELAAAGKKEVGGVWLLFASGQIVRAECIAWDLKRDLALLHIRAAQHPSPHSPRPSPSSSFNSSSSPLALSLPSFSFPCLSLSVACPVSQTPLLCIGHPGSEDLEASTPGVKTDHPVLSVSAGRFRGLALGQDVQDNEEIGALMHDCWTYWGHSGAPLVERRAQSGSRRGRGRGKGREGEKEGLQVEKEKGD